jgi:predicted RNA binding protein YcfA (HicA-like mRNA interferase family)
VKRTGLITRIAKSGCIFVRHGGNHDWYRNPVTGVHQPVPCHTEINDYLARAILKRLGVR